MYTKLHLLNFACLNCLRFFFSVVGGRLWLVLLYEGVDEMYYHITFELLLYKSINNLSSLLNLSKLYVNGNVFTKSKFVHQTFAMHSTLNIPHLLGASVVSSPTPHQIFSYSLIHHCSESPKNKSHWLK